MNESNIIRLCLQICIMILTALTCTKITDKLGFPTVVGELLGGIILGPTILGSIFPFCYSYLFLSSSKCSIGLETIIKLGQIFFLFTVGLEMNLVLLKKQIRNVVTISLFSILIPFFMGIGVVRIFPDIWGLQLINRDKLTLFIGIAVSISALPVIARILMHLELLNTKLGNLILSAATINDFLGWVLFSLILRDMNSDLCVSKSMSCTIGLILCFILLIGVVYYISKPERLSGFIKVFPTKSHCTAALVMLILFASAISQFLGINAMFGAFLIGSVFTLRLDPKSVEGFDSIRKFTNSFFVPIYFVSVGLKINFISNLNWFLIIIVLSVACIGKVSGAFIGARICRISFINSLIVAFAMNVRGAMEIILASVAFEYHFINEEIFVALITMAVITTLISGPVMQKLLHKSTEKKDVIFHRKIG
ncbi:cation:proton antiporter [Aminipila terrae]|uniref:Cation/H+ exchanger transmembrane domain-containing protein n=1 Tax=Aminipila terrae TaxID=2697030 RepID=A0A6P1M9P8_9FIRM|nr:cation:proton antiporter [Aminipila terrae]QHI71439.1 hypothetical protein Ami3637_02745 [Aminipila terrae]